MSPAHVVIGGASGFLGHHLAEHLTQSGVPVVCGSRSPDRAAQRAPDRTWCRFDVDDPESMTHALRGARTLVYLVHRMGADDDLLCAEERAAHHTVQACRDAGIDHVIYVGAPQVDGMPSHHLLARMRTGQILRQGLPRVLELRAAMIVGPGSMSWMIVRDLAFRLPAMVLPSWLRTESRPIALQDVLVALEHAVRVAPEPSRVADLPGPEAMSAWQILQRVAACRGTRPIPIFLPWMSPRLSSHWIRWVTRADYDVAKELVESLTHDLCMDPVGYWKELPDHRRMDFDESVRQTLADEHELGGFDAAWERIAARVSRRAARLSRNPQAT